MQLIRHTAFTRQYEALGHTLVSHGPETDTLLVNYSAPPTTAKRLYDYLISEDLRSQDSMIFWGGDTRIGFPREVFIQEIPTALPCGMRNVVLSHPAFAAKGLDADVMFYSPDGAAPRGFVERIQHALNVPIKADWSAAVWWVLTHPAKAGLDLYDNPLEPLHVLGRGQAWQLRTDDDYWLDVLRVTLPLLRKEEKPWEHSLAATAPTIES